MDIRLKDNQSTQSENLYSLLIWKGNIKLIVNRTKLWLISDQIKLIGSIYQTIKCSDYCNAKIIRGIYKIYKVVPLVWSVNKWTSTRTIPQSELA